MTKITQSSTHFCFVCGVDNPFGLKINFQGDGNGFVSAQTVFISSYQGYPGIVHGGVISAVLDEAAGRATVLGKRPEVVLVTGKLVVHFRKPVKINELILIEGRMINHTSRVYQAESCLKSKDGVILAEAEVTLVQPGDQLVGAIQPGDDQWVDLEENEGDNDN